MIYRITALCLVFISSIFSAHKESKKFRCLDEAETQVQPLILTELINRGEIVEAQSKAFVQIEDFRDVISYAGYFQVNKEFESNLFFWYFPSRSNVNIDPVVLWLQGGPGFSALLGLFVENGPFELANKFDIRLRMYSWTKRFSVIYVDNPVGTGFSFTKQDGYAQNQTIIAKELYIALKQFYKMFPMVATNDFYIMSEAYGGKFAIKLAELIHHSNPKKKKKVHLKGLALGSAFCDPINQIGYGDYLYEIGLIDHIAREKFYFLENCIKEHIKNKQWIEAFQTFDYLIRGDLNRQTLYKNLTGLESYYNYMKDSDTIAHFSVISYYINLEELRKALHVGFAHFNLSSEYVVEHLRPDIMQSVISSLPPLLRSYKVLFYNGQFDVISGYDMSENILINMGHAQSADYENVSRCIWRVGDEVAGYVKSIGNLTQVMVRNAGHMVPADQPKWSFDMIIKFVANINFCQ